MAHTIIGTAGHIDHGKTLLVKALTGTDTDRAPEEKARGITIELGFAFYGDRATIIDVPGHERFVKTMVAGVSTVDVAMLVIAADDGVMPQSREHLDVLELMGVRRGFVVLNKADLADEDWLELVEEDVRELGAGTFLEGTPIFQGAALTGAGVDALQAELDRLIEATEERQAEGPFRLPVDRSFLVKGFGLVNTGTVLSGKLSEGDSFDLLPAGRSVRVRGLQRHGQTVDSVACGDRAAINLPGLKQDEVVRGDVLATSGYFHPTQMLDVRLRLLQSSPRELAQRARVRLHIATSEVLARLVMLNRDALEPGGSILAQLHLESPVVAVWGDRFAIRSYSPALTIGGGQVLDPHPSKHRRSTPDRALQLERLEAEDAAELVGGRLANAREAALSAAVLAGHFGWSSGQVAEVLRELEAAGRAQLLHLDGQSHGMHADEWSSLQANIRDSLADYHQANPLKPGLRREELRSRCARYLQEGLFERALSALEEEGTLSTSGAIVHLTTHQIRLSERQEELRAGVEGALKSATFAEMPGAEELAARLRADQVEMDQLLGALRSMDRVTALEGGLLLHCDTLAAVRRQLDEYLRAHGEITVAQFRDLIDGNRKYALALLAQFDGTGFTERQGDVRVRGRR